MTSTKSFRVIGQRAIKAGGVPIVQGHAAYTDDLLLPEMLYGRVLRSPHAHAIIKRVDTSKARALKGVHAVVTGRDFPSLAADAAFPMGAFSIPLGGIAAMVMGRKKVLFHGQPVAAVAAVDPWVAEEALRHIRVEYEVLEPVLDVQDAMRPDAPLVNPEQKTVNLAGQVVGDRPTNVAMKMDLGRGDVEKGLAEADVVVEETYTMGTAHQGYLEPTSAVARAEPDGQMTIWCGPQGSFATQLQVAGILNIAPGKVRVIPMEVGGAFGGKIFTIVEPVAALLAQKTGRPVKVTLSREEVLRASGPGSSGVVKVKSGCKRDGTITAIDCWIALDAGFTPGGPTIYTLGTATAPYGKVANVRIQGFDVLTNTPQTHPYRAPGAPQVAFAVEQNVDAMAKAIRMDSLELRLKNCTQEGDPDIFNRPFKRIGLKEVLEMMRQHPHYRAPLEGPHRGRGIALGFWPGNGMTSSATVTISPSGTASVVVGSVDLTGSRTAVQQVAAEELGLDLESVSVTTGDTASVGYTDVTGGSRITYTMTAAVRLACQEALAQLRKRAASRFKVPEDQVDYGMGKFTLKGSPEKSASLADLAPASQPAVVGRGSTSDLKPAPAFSGHIADVEVDPQTGKVRVLRYTAFQDVGLAINPTRVEAQIQGAVAQGIGWALNEEFVRNAEGALLNASLLDYRLPTSTDMPLVDVDYVEVPASDGPYGARGVAESPITPVAATLGNAIASATGVRPTHMPMNPERLFWALRETMP